MSPPSNGALSSEAASNPGGLSARSHSNVELIMPKIRGQLEQRAISDNPNIDLATAENWLIRDSVIAIAKEAIEENLKEGHLSYPNGFSGDPALLASLASFLNRYFSPHKPVLPAHIATAPGAASCLDACLFNICDPGEGVLVPAPYWNGFDFQFKVRSSVTPIAVTTADLKGTMTGALIPALEEAFEKASCPVKGMILTNPHNPLSQCYGRSILEDCVRFCAKRRIHLIVDEVYALSLFECKELPNPPPFVSVLSLDIESLGGNPSMVHAIWSPSKDFGQSGFRMGCTVTQANQEMLVGLALASNTQTSSLSSIVVTALLNSPKLDELISANAAQLAANYHKLTDLFKQCSISYIPAYAGLYVFARVAPDAQSWDDESKVVSDLKNAGVLVSSGKGYHGPEGDKGWARVGFAVHPEVLDKAISRMSTVLMKR